MAQRSVWTLGLVFPLLMLGACRDSDPAAAPSATTNTKASPVNKDDLPQRPTAPPVVFNDDYKTGHTWFDDVTERSGVTFVHVSGNSPQKPFPAANGSGVGALDYDLDGRYDLYFATGTTFPLDYSRRDPSNRCYRNRGDLQFEDVTDQADLRHAGYSAGIAVGDFDADGFPYIYVVCFGPNCLFRNLGDGTFERVETTAGVDDAHWGTSAAFFDYDDDGLLDLYVCNYAKWTFEQNPFCGDRERGIRMHCGPRTVEAEPHLLYHNEGDGTFRNALADANLADHPGRGQGIVAADMNKDGLIDIYIGNDLHANFLFINDGGGKYRDATETSGAAYDAGGSPQASMGVDASDLDRDGLPEIITTNFQLEYNTLYRNLGDCFFVDASDRMGIVADSLPFIGWGTQFVDFDLDGWLDLVITNGHVDDNRHLFKENAPYEQPAFLYRLDGMRYRRIGREAGDYFLQNHVGRGLIASDLDNDGDEDVVIVHQDDRPAVLKNLRLPADKAASATDAPPPASLRLRLVGRRVNRDAIGALLEFKSPLGAVYDQVKGGGSYLSAPDLRRTFAVPAGATSAEIACQIRWPGGQVTDIAPGTLSPGGRYTVVQPADADAREVTPTPEIVR